MLLSTRPVLSGCRLKRHVTTGWTCLEVGAGGGSIAAWLCDQVGSTGRLSTKRACTRSNVFAGDLPDPDAALSKLARAMKPRGWLLIEDFDHLTCGHVDPADPQE